MLVFTFAPTFEWMARYRAVRPTENGRGTAINYSKVLGVAMCGVINYSDFGKKGNGDGVRNEGQITSPQAWCGGELELLVAVLP